MRDNNIATKKLKTGQDEKTSSQIEEGSFSVYPNPVENKEIKIHFTNLAPGNYKLQLFDISGKLVFDKIFFISKRETLTSFLMSREIAAGSYQLSLSNQKGEKMQEQILIN